MDRSSRPFNSTDMVLPLFAAACSVFALLVLVSSGFGTRAGLWPFRTGISLLKFAAYCGLGCAILSLVSGLIAARSGRRAPLIIALAAFVCALIAIGVPYSFKAKVDRYPRIHDISTDVNNPPVFVAVLQFRSDPAVYPGAAVAAQQLKAYPDLRTLALPVPGEKAFQAALNVAKEMGWQIVAAVPAEGRIEATDTTFWFGFKDDIVIRVSPSGQGSLVDVRSVSRVGISDLGANAARIRAYLAKLSRSLII